MDLKKFIRGSSRSQIELSMLTRFAMVFFIMALSLVLLLFSNTEQKGLCRTQAELTARQIASSVNQVLTSPAEDERKVIPLIAALSVGQQDRSKYTVNITQRTDSNYFVIGVYANEKDCSAFQSVGYGSDANVVIQNSRKFTQPNDPHKLKEYFGSASYDVLQLTPSNPADRTSYLILLKCQSKTLDPVTFKPKKYLYLQNCNFLSPGETSVNPDLCLNLKSDPNNPVDVTCGFSVT